MTSLPTKSLRMHIGIFGRRNVGKSSILNCLTNQYVSIVSPIAGTTTDPVEKAMELLPVGPVQFIDTAGIDDEGALGNQRIQKSRQALERVDIALIVTTASQWGEYEQMLHAEFMKRSVPCIAVLNKTDCEPHSDELLSRLASMNIPAVHTSALTAAGVADLRQQLLRVLPDDYINRNTIVSDLVTPGQIVVLVVPIDKEAPKGRLILPQVQCIRDLLDHNCVAMVTQEHELRHTLAQLAHAPSLVVTDSQAFVKVAADTPQSVPLTSFSILFARFLADLPEMVAGAMAIDGLKPNDRVLVAEACTHHPISEDIGTVKIPAWLKQYCGGGLAIDHVRGHDFPVDITPYKLIIHCGACMTNRREMLNRILLCRAAHVPITNYGLTIAYSLGIFERALRPFPSAVALYRTIKEKRTKSYCYEYINSRN
ncbi:MAG: [FeFe] hydrogenase H-cluster maturation GTPase HydF [Chitinivibrionales bacterium]|nr:[FeFe] hydrogenase H-cluster maturation GTPase HydF [Chitinivibrionales bacterium]